MKPQLLRSNPILALGLGLSMTAMLGGGLPAKAQQTYTMNARFLTNNQSLWGNGASVGFDLTQDLTVPWNTGDFDEGSWKHVSVAGISLGTYGAGFNGSASGTAGLRFRNYASDGSLNINFPIQVTITSSANGPLKPGDTFTLSTDWAPDPNANLNTDLGDFNVQVNGILQGNWSFEGRVEAASQNIVDFTADDSVDTAPLLLDTGLLSSGTTTLGSIGDYGTVTYSPTRIQTSGGLLAGTKDQLAASSGTLPPFLSLSSNLTNLIVGTTSGLPSFNFDKTFPGGSIGFHLLDLVADLDLGCRQDFVFKAVPKLVLQLSTGQSINVKLGDRVTLTMPDPQHNGGHPDLTITPIFNLEGHLQNTTTLEMTPDLIFTPLNVYARANFDVFSFDFQYEPVAPINVLGILNGILPSWSNALTYYQTYQPAEVITKSFPVGGFNQVTGTRIVIAGATP